MTAPPILLIANNFPPVRGGSAVVYDNLARHLADRVIVVAPRINYLDNLPLIGWREHDRRVGYAVTRLRLLRTPLVPEGKMGGLRRALFLLADVGIRINLLWVILRRVLFRGVRTICIGELLASSWIISLGRWVPGLRVIAYVHGEEITTEDSYDRGHLRARKALLRADRIVVVSRFTAAAVAALLRDDSRIVLIENGVDTTRFQQRGRQQDLVARYRLQDCFIFVSVCRLLEKKGIDNALRAFADVARQHANTRFLVVGTGPYEAALRGLADELRLRDQVIFVGEVPAEELVDHYCLGDVFVMPNRELPNGDTEGFGLVFLEANACGLPVIAGSDGGSRDAVQDGVNGLVVNGKSVPEIRGAMLRLLDDEGLRDAIRRAGLKTASAADWSRKAEAFLRVCDA